MSDTFSLCHHITSLLAALINAYLLFVYFRCPLSGISSFKYFFPLAAIQDLVLSISVTLTVPRLLLRDYFFIYIATGPVRDKVGGIIFLTLDVMAFVSSMMIVADSFLYRYLLVCRAQLFESYMTKRNILLAVVANLLIISIWMICAVYIILWPSAQFIESCSSMVALDTGLNSSECALLGVSFEANKLPLFVIINVSLTIIAIIMAYAALEINAMLRKSTISGNVRKLHRRMLTMLLLQAACPILLLHTPLFVAFVYLIAGWSAPLKVSYTITILRTLFPLPNPIITIAFVSEYRVYTLSKLKLL